MDERHAPPGEHPLDEPVDELGRDPRRHDDEVERARGRALLDGEERGERRAAGRLQGGEKLERPPPVAVRGVDALRLARGRVHDEDRPAAVPHVRAEDRAGRAHLHVEALADGPARVGVEEDGDLVARRVLEVLHHQLPAAGGRAPVHLPQRLAVHVLAHAVQLEAARPAQEQLPAVDRVRAGLGEQAVELDEARVDEERAAARELHLGLLQPERVLEERARLAERVAPARQRAQHVAAEEPPVAAAEGHAALAEPAHLVDEDDRDRQHAPLRLELEMDAQVLALELLVRARRADEPHRLLREAHGRPCEEDDEEEAGRDRVQRDGAERPRGDVRGGAEREREAAVPGHA